MTEDMRNLHFDLNNYLLAIAEGALAQHRKNLVEGPDLLVLEPKVAAAFQHLGACVAKQPESLAAVEVVLQHMVLSAMQSVLATLDQSSALGEGESLSVCDQAGESLSGMLHSSFNRLLVGKGLL